MDLALDEVQRLICHKTTTKKQTKFTIIVKKLQIRND